MKIIRVLAFAFIPLLIVGCPREEPKKPEKEAPVVQAEPEVKDEEKEKFKDGELRLINAGEEPRQELRYSISEESEGSIELEIVMTMLKPQAISLPPINVRMNISDTSIEPDGFSYAFDFDEPQMKEASEDIPADRLGELQKDLAPIGELSGKISLDHRGQFREMSFASEEVGNQFDQLITELEKSVRRMLVPLPEEAVGKGAEWEIDESLKMDDIALRQTTAMNLVEMENGKLSIETTVKQSAERQKMQSAEMPPDAEMFLDSLTGSSTGVVHVDLSSLFPHKPIVSTSTTDMAVEVSMQGQKQVMEASFKMEITMNSSKED